MQHDPDASRIRHMLDAAQAALELARERSRDDLHTDLEFGLATRKLLEILGEAAKHVSAGLQAMHPDIPWRRMAQTRDRLIHGYFDIDYDVVWDIVTKDLPGVVASLEELVPPEGE